MKSLQKTFLGSLLKKSLWKISMKSLLEKSCQWCLDVWYKEKSCKKNHLSASSRQRYVVLLRLIFPISKKSKRRPGVAITISQPFSTSRSWGPLGAPPNTQVFLILDEPPKSAATCNRHHCWSIHIFRQIECLIYKWFELSVTHAGNIQLLHSEDRRV